MGLPVPFVFSHDSIGIGRNGPTHQPVEFLASLRAIPNMLVLRPADAVEAAECWEIALEHRTGPSALIFARQHLAARARRAGPTENLSAGAAPMCCRRAERCAPGDDLLATGSEVAIAMAARDLLAAEGVAAAVVSMPSWELFERQPDEYRQAVLGTGAASRGRGCGPPGLGPVYRAERAGSSDMSGFGASGSGMSCMLISASRPSRIADEARLHIDRPFHSAGSKSVDA